MGRGERGTTRRVLSRAVRGPVALMGRGERGTAPDGGRSVVGRDLRAFGGRWASPAWGERWSMRRAVPGGGLMTCGGLWGGGA